MIYLMMAGAGLLAGLLAGVFGIGGGVILVPVLLVVFQQMGLADAQVMQLAVGTSLAIIVLTSSVSSFSHHRHGYLRWDRWAWLAPGLVLGGWLGGAVAHRVHSDWLELAFGIFFVLMAGQIAFEILPSRPREGKADARLSLAGVVVGTISSLVGVGGGVMVVPLLLWTGTAAAEAVATSAACTLVVALAGTSAFIYQGWSLSDLPQPSLGYVYLPAVAGFAIASMLAAPWGARLAHRLPRNILRRAFALLLVGVGAWMVMGAVA